MVEPRHHQQSYSSSVFRPERQIDYCREKLNKKGDVLQENRAYWEIVAHSWWSSLWQRISVERRHWWSSPNIVDENVFPKQVVLSYRRTFIALVLPCLSDRNANLAVDATSASEWSVLWVWDWVHLSLFVLNGIPSTCSRQRESAGLTRLARCSDNVSTTDTIVDQCEFRFVLVHSIDKIRWTAIDVKARPTWDSPWLGSLSNHCEDRRSKVSIPTNVSNRYVLWSREGASRSKWLSNLIYRPQRRHRCSLLHSSNANISRWNHARRLKRGICVDTPFHPPVSFVEYDAHASCNIPRPLYWHSLSSEERERERKRSTYIRIDVLIVILARGLIFFRCLWLRNSRFLCLVIRFLLGFHLSFQFTRAKHKDVFQSTFYETDKINIQMRKSQG